MLLVICFFFFFSSRRRHTRSLCDWSSDVCSSDLCSRTLTRRRCPWPSCRGPCNRRRRDSPGRQMPGSCGTRKRRKKKGWCDGIPGATGERAQGAWREWTRDPAKNQSRVRVPFRVGAAAREPWVKLTMLNIDTKLRLIGIFVNGTSARFCYVLRRWLTDKRGGASEPRVLMISSRRHSGRGTKWTNSSQCKARCRSKPTRRNYRDSTAIW